MSGPAGCRALIVEPDPGLNEAFELLLDGWTLQFVQDPWVIPEPPADVDLLVIDEDYAERSDKKTPAWLETLTRRVPMIVLRTPTASFSANPSLLLPKPFPVSLFLSFADTVRRAKARSASSPQTGP